MGVNYNSPLWK